MGIYLTVIIINTVLVVLTILDPAAKQTMIQQIQNSGQQVSDELINVFTLLTAGAGILAVIAIPFLVALIYHVLAMLQSKTGFKKTLSLYMHVQLIPLLNSVIVYAVQSITGKTIEFSPVMFLAPETTSNVIMILASYLNIFTIWTYVLLYIGFRKTHEMNEKEALITIAIPMILGLVIMLITKNTVAV